MYPNGRMSGGEGEELLPSCTANNNHGDNHASAAATAATGNCKPYCAPDVERGAVRLPSKWHSPGKKPRVQRQPRLVAKNGDCTIRPCNLHDSFSICVRNWFHLVIEHSWRRIFLMFSAGFLCSWLSFGLAYYLIVHLSGDIQNLSENRQCIANVHSFTSAFLFSLESQHTIGYGTRYMTESCPLAYATLSLQCIVGVLLQTILAGIVIAKVLRPKKRKQEMRFSEKAVIGPVDEDDQRPALMIRLADIQHKLYIAESHVRLYMATTKINKKGECELVGIQDMNVGYDYGMDRVLLLWPVVIRHIIDNESPLWEITEEKLKTCQFELIMTVEGIVEATGMAFQARTSFLQDEILWGRRFVPLITLNQSTNNFEVDYNLFDSTESHPIEPWLPEESRLEEEMRELHSKLAVISEKDSPNVHQHMPNGILPGDHPVSMHQRFRRKSVCSIGAGSVGKRSMCGIRPEIEDPLHVQQPIRKTSRGSTLHSMLRRTGTNDSSPMVSSNNIGGGAGAGCGPEEGDEGLGGPVECVAAALSALPAMPASFVVHTLQHSGFT